MTTHPHLRYQIIEKSLSAHCCFQYTVIDTTCPLLLKSISQEEYNSYPLDSTLFPVEKNGQISLYYKHQFHIICECFHLEEATLVCNALNT